jgi:hypothetical protein
VLINNQGNIMKSKDRKALFQKHGAKTIESTAETATKHPIKGSKVKKVMHEYKEGKLHSGSKKGPVVTNPKQAVAIAIHESKQGGKRKK